MTNNAPVHFFDVTLMTWYCPITMQFWDHVYIIWSNLEKRLSWQVDAFSVVVRHSLSQHHPKRTDQNFISVHVQEYKLQLWCLKSIIASCFNWCFKSFIAYQRYQNISFLLPQYNVSNRYVHVHESYSYTLLHGLMFIMSNTGTLKTHLSTHI